MLWSTLPRNTLLISGVLISHLLVLLALLLAPFEDVNSSASGALMVSLLDENAPQSMPKKLSNAPLVNASLNTKSYSSPPLHSSGALGEGQELDHSINSAARAAMYSPKPHYPLVSRQLREEGLVLVKLCVNEQGVVNQINLIQSSGFQGLDHSALKALASWRFTPRKLPTFSPSSQCFQTPVQFTLEG